MWYLKKGVQRGEENKYCDRITLTVNLKVKLMLSVQNQNLSSTKHLPTILDFLSNQCI